MFAIWAVVNLEGEGKRLWLSSLAVKGGNAFTAISQGGASFPC